jgi:hypothetical protein
MRGSSSAITSRHAAPEARIQRRLRRLQFIVGERRVHAEGGDRAARARQRIAVIGGARIGLRLVSRSAQQVPGYTAVLTSTSR